MPYEVASWNKRLWLFAIGNWLIFEVVKWLPLSDGDCICLIDLCRAGASRSLCVGFVYSDGDEGLTVALFSDDRLEHHEGSGSSPIFGHYNHYYILVALRYPTPKYPC